MRRGLYKSKDAVFLEHLAALWQPWGAGITDGALGGGFVSHLRACRQVAIYTLAGHTPAATMLTRGPGHRTGPLTWLAQGCGPWSLLTGHSGGSRAVRGGEVYSARLGLSAHGL